MTIATDLDQLADRHDPDPVDRRRPEGELRPPGRPDGRRADGLRRCGRASCATPRRTRTGPTATGSCCRAGHASMLLYSLLHLTGYDVSLEDLEAFRQWGSQHARPPRVRPDARASRRRPGRSARASPTPSGMAIAERRLAAEFNRPGHDDRRPPDVRASPPTATSRRASPPRRRQPRRPPAARQARRPLRRQPHPARRADGDGLVARTSSSGSRPTAGTPSGSRTATTSTRSTAAIEAARADDRPSLIAVRTHIGYGSPNKQDTPEGARRAARARRGPPHQGGLRLGSGPDVLRPGRGAARCSATRSPRGEALVADWEARARRATRRRIPDAGRASSRRRIAGRLPDGWDAGLQDLRRRATEVATRNASQDAIQALAPRAARAVRRRGRPVGVEPDRRQGRRRTSAPTSPAGTCASASASTHGRRSPTASPTTAGSSRTARTFLTFSDYMRGSVRLAALSGLHVIYVWTHDSVGLGEDGPTHQPVEHYAALRAIPNLWFVRPGDANETAAAWALAVERARRAGRAGAHPPEAADAAPARPSTRARASRAAATSCARPRGGDARS